MLNSIRVVLKILSEKKIAEGQKISI